MLGGIAWACAIVFVMAGALVYDTKPGKQPVGEPGLRAADPGRWTLLMVVHPDCPCTKASLRNLAAIVETTRLPLKVQIVAAMPQRYDGPKSNLTLARGIPKATVTVLDADVAIQRHGALTSGHLFVFDPDRRLVYSGGVTPARGAEDATSSIRWFRALVEQRAVASSAPTYGCSLTSFEGVARG